MKTIKNLYTIHTIFMTLMAVSLGLGLVFFATNNLDFLISAIDYGKFSVPNLAYWLAKIVGGIIVPLLFLIPSQTELGRIKSVKLTFIVYGALQLLTLSWFFYFLASGPNSYSNDAITAFQEKESLVATYVLWDTYSWIGSVFTLLFGGLCIFCGIVFDDNKKKVRICVLLLLVLRILLPIIANIIEGQTLLSTFWITNNYADILSFAALSVAVFLASMHDMTWVSLIWDQELAASSDENDD